MRNKNKGVVVTGATSMIGIALIEECVKNNIPVAAIIRPHTKRISRLPKTNLITIYESELSELSNVDIPSGLWDVFYHLAWSDTGKDTRDNPNLQEKNIKYTLDAVNLAKKLGCTTFIGAGSQAEYGPVDGVISPDTKTNPVIAYGMAKEAARMLSSRLCDIYGIKHIWGRIFSVYGRYDNEGTMLVYAIKKLLSGEMAEFSTGSQPWDYLNEYDAGRALYLLGKSENAKGTYCIAFGKSRPLKEYILELGRQLGAVDRLIFAKQGEKKDVGIQADIDKLKRDTGFVPEVSFSVGIQRMINAYKENT